MKVRDGARAECGRRRRGQLESEEGESGRDRTSSEGAWSWRAPSCRYSLALVNTLPVPGGRWGPVQITVCRFGGRPIPVEGRCGGSSADRPEVTLNDYANAPPEARTSRRLVYIYTA